MPIAKLKCVIEVSSECSNFPASNLLKPETGKKWKTKTVGVKSAYVIFELERPTQITGIDIGNEHSAFIEVLASSCGYQPDNFSEILMACSFMTPIESKSSSNSNRVRCFNKDGLVETPAKEKTHFIKVLCSQPFNKHVQYGLSFVKFHIVEAEISKIDVTPKALVPNSSLMQIRDTNSSYGIKDDKEKSSNATKMLTKFGLREESRDSDSESSVALFSRWRKCRIIENRPTTGASIPLSSTISSLKKPIEDLKRSLPILKHSSTNENPLSEIRDRNRADVSFGPDDESSNEDKKLQIISKHIQAEKEYLKAHRELAEQNNKVEKSKNTKNELDKRLTGIKHKEKERSVLNINTNLRKNRISSGNVAPSKKLKTEIAVKYRPFNELLQGVVVTISGIQNPDRANLRKKALAMGAKYKADWEADCTHLICAFKNTPKYNQIQGKGKIVKRAWIEECFEQKKNLPWRRYALDSDEQTKPESDFEILADTFKSKTDQNFTHRSQRNIEIVTADSFVIDSDNDTDDDIERILQKNYENGANSQDRKNFDAATDEEEYVRQKTEYVKDFFNFFKNMIFFIDGTFPQGTKDHLKTCILHYGGSVAHKLSEAGYLIADNIPEVCKSGNFNGEIIQSQWIFLCNDVKRRVPVEPFIVSD